jgi:hypothetical protein
MSAPNERSPAKPDPKPAGSALGLEPNLAYRETPTSTSRAVAHQREGSALGLRLLRNIFSIRYTRNCR